VLDYNVLGNTRLDDFEFDDTERDDSEHGKADILSIPNLGWVKEFMITSEPFHKLRDNLRDFVFPSRQHILKDLVGRGTQRLVNLCSVEEVLLFCDLNTWKYYQ